MSVCAEDSRQNNVEGDRQTDACLTHLPKNVSKGSANNVPVPPKTQSMLTEILSKKLYSSHMIARLVRCLCGGYDELNERHENVRFVFKKFAAVCV